MDILKISLLETRTESHIFGNRTLLLNIKAIAVQLNQPVSNLLKYLKYVLGTKTFEDQSKDYFALKRRYSPFLLRSLINKYVIEYLLCYKCGQIKTILYFGLNSKNIYKICTLCKGISETKATNFKFHLYLQQRLPSMQEPASTDTSTAAVPVIKNALDKLCSFVLPPLSLGSPEKAFCDLQSMKPVNAKLVDMLDCDSSGSVQSCSVLGARVVARKTPSEVAAEYFADYLRNWPPEYLHVLPSEEKKIKHNVGLFIELTQMAVMVDNLNNIRLHTALYKSAEDLKIVNLVPGVLIAVLPIDIPTNLIKYRYLFQRFTANNEECQLNFLKDLQCFLLRNFIKYRSFVIDIFTYLYELDIINDHTFIAWYYDAPVKTILHSHVAGMIHLMKAYRK